MTQCAWLACACCVVSLACTSRNEAPRTPAPATTQPVEMAAGESGAAGTTAPPRPVALGGAGSSAPRAAPSGGAGGAATGSAGLPSPAGGTADAAVTPATASAQSGSTALAGAGGSYAGNSAGAAGAAGRDTTSSCPFPTTFKWTSTGPLAQPKSPPGRNFVSLKDFTIVRWQDAYHVYATVFDTTKSWSTVYFRFTDWAQADAAEQIPFTRNAVAPTLLYFRPKQTWVLLYQWGFQYATSSDPSQPSSWSQGKPLLSGGPSSGTGPIDQTAICDTSNCYLFFAADNGNIYRASLPIADFPGTFANPVAILTDSTNKLFEAVQVYSVKGTSEYLMIVEAIGSGGRYFRAFRAPSLNGTFKALEGAATEATPFAGKSNVTFEDGAWTNDISHGDLVRSEPDETQPIDPCNMQFLYQGFDKSKAGGDYGKIPYRPGLLTLQK